MKLTNNRYLAAFAVLTLAGTQVHAANTGINTLAPSSQLTVNGNFAVGAGYTATAAPTNGAIIQGRTGVGTSAPQSQLHVIAPTGIYPGTFEGNQPGGGGVQVVIRNNNANYQTGLNFSDATGTKGWTLLNNTNATDDFQIYSKAIGRASIYMTNQGFVSFASSTSPTTPIAPVTVGTQGTVVSSGPGSFFAYYTGTTIQSSGIAAGTYGAGIYSAASIWTSGSFISVNGGLTASDERLKNIIGVSDSAADLATLKGIQITDYTMKDSVRYGKVPFKEVVAQQVEKAYPTAVRTIGSPKMSYLPDIYTTATSVTPGKDNSYTIHIAKEHGLKAGGLVRLVTADNYELDVTADKVIDATTFTVVTKAPLDGKVFVYGKECTDMKGVDYEAIAMLNVSATQELAKHDEVFAKQVEEQQNQLIALKAENAELKKLAAEVREMKAAFVAMQAAKGDKLETVSLTK
jgi:hypothetical protein